MWSGPIAHNLFDEIAAGAVCPRPRRHAGHRHRPSPLDLEAIERGGPGAGPHIRRRLPPAPRPFRRGALSAHGRLRPADELPGGAACRSGLRSSTWRSRRRRGCSTGRGASPADVERDAPGCRSPSPPARSCWRASSAGFSLGEAAGVALALFVALCPGHILWTQYGHTDQHVAESFFGLLALFLFVAQPAANLERAATGCRGRRRRWRSPCSPGRARSTGERSSRSRSFSKRSIPRRERPAPALLILAAPARVAAAATALWLGRPAPAPDVRLLRVLPAALPRARSPAGRSSRHAPRARGGASSPGGELLWRVACCSRRGRGGPRALRRRRSPRARQGRRLRRSARRARSPRPAGTSRTRRTGSKGSSRRGRSSPTGPGWPCAASPPRSSSRRSSLVALGRARARASDRPALHVALAVWGAVTLFSRSRSG